MEENSGDVKYDKAGNPDYDKKDSHDEKRAKTHDPPPRRLRNLTADARRQSS
jgi:hypothetical protein